MRRLALATIACLAACGADDVGRSDSASAAASSGTGLRAEYFDGYLDSKLVRIEPNVSHAWGTGAPASGVGKDHFSARWTGTLTPPVASPGPITIGTDADDGVRVWIDGKLVIDDWHAHVEERHSAVVTLDRPVSIRVDYFEIDEDAQIALWWSGAGLPEAVIPADRFTTSSASPGLPSPKPPITNPVIDSDCPDPGVLADGGQYYLACTGGKFSIEESRDLVTWSATGKSILPSGKPPWADNGDRNWAPEIHRLGASNFVAYYTSVNDANILSIGVASAPSPLGPFTDSGVPLVENDLGVIDATEFTDDDGSKYLFYKIDGNSQGKPTPIYVRKLADNGLSFAPGSSPKQAITNAPSSWEGGVVEAPWVVKRNGFYYLIYSGNVYDQRYRTGVARASSLNGPWTKKGEPILANNDAWVGPGHGSVVVVPTSDGQSTQDYFVYHAWKNAGAGAADQDLGRVVLVDRITWVTGWPQIGDGSPTSGPQPWPGEDR